MNFHNELNMFVAISLMTLKYYISILLVLHEKFIKCDITQIWWKRGTKSGIIKIRFNYDVEDETLNYAGIDYSDYNIQDYVKRNPSVLRKIDFQMNYELTH